MSEVKLLITIIWGHLKLRHSFFAKYFFFRIISILSGTSKIKLLITIIQDVY